MTIKHSIDTDGGFTAGDTETGITAYSYPTSHYSTNAKRHAAATAETMLRIEATSRKWTPLSIAQSYDARNWARLNTTTD